MDDLSTEFKRGAVRPVECLRGGWALIKEEYWLFLGIVFIGMLIGGAAPFGLLTGPMMCGIHLCLLRRIRGRPTDFSMLFEGFQYFGPSFVATLFMIVPMMLLSFLGSFGMIIGMFAIL